MPNEIVVGLDIFLERYATREYVGRLIQENNDYIFTYRKSYLKYKNSIPLGPEFPLTQIGFHSPSLFPSLQDRLPDPDNPAYEDYCAAVGISKHEKNTILLLGTIGKRGPSSFIFELAYKDAFDIKACEEFRQQLELSLDDFAHLFEVSLSILQKMKAGKTSGKEILKRIEIFAKFPEVLARQVKLQGKWLHSNKLEKVKFYLNQITNDLKP